MPPRRPSSALSAVLLLSLVGCASAGNRPDPVSIDEVVAMSQSGLAKEEVLTRIRESRTVYVLRARDVKELLDHGVAEEIVDYMLETRVEDLERRLRRSYDQPRFFYSWGYPWPGRYYCY